MEIGDRIKELRISKNMTQKQLADKLFITPQALSKWEMNENEPSLDMIKKLCQEFDVSLSYLVSGEEEKKPEEVTNNIEETKNEVAIVPAIQAETSTEPKVIEKVIVKEEAKPILALCSRCNKPLYKQDEIVRRTIPHTERHGKHHTTTYTNDIICKDCNHKILEEEKRARQESYINRCELVKRRRIRSYVWGSLITLAAFGIALGVCLNIKGLQPGFIALYSLLTLLLFPFLGCIFLNNNFIIYVFAKIFSFSFVKMPGIIFSLSFDGLKFLIFCKILFAIIGFSLGVFFFLLALAISCVLSVFVYPFALYNSYNNPEKEDAL